MEAPNTVTPNAKSQLGTSLSENLLAAFSPQNFSRDQLAKIIGEAMLKTAMIDSTPLNNTLNMEQADVLTSTPTQQATASEAELPIAKEQASGTSESTKKKVIEKSFVASRPFVIPAEEINRKLQTIESITSLIGNKSLELEQWSENLQGILNSYLRDLELDKQQLNESFIVSLETISIISSITSRFSASFSSNLHSYSNSSTGSENDIHISQILNESSDTSVTLKLQQLIIDYKSGSYTSLEDYCSDKSTMYALSKTIEKTIIKLIPILSGKITDFTKKLHLYYTKLKILMGSFELEPTDFKINDQFSRLLPTFELVSKNYNSPLSLNIEDIKNTLQSNYRNINPELMQQTDKEITRLNEVILQRCQYLKTLQFKILKVNHLIYEKGEMGYIESTSSNFKDNETIISKVGVDVKTIQKYESQLQNLQNLQKEREQMQASMKASIIEIWSMLHSDTNNTKIENDLTSTSTLFESSLEKRKYLLNTLENEKKENIGRFIFGIRKKIQACWDKLMYDEVNKSKFSDFYINDETLLNEDILHSHNSYLRTLEQEMRELEPMLETIEQMDNLLHMKTELDEAQKNPSRLLKQNSFKVLRKEEITRKKIDTELPVAVNKLKLCVQDWEDRTGRHFKVNDIDYSIRLEEIENSLPKRRSFIRPFSATSSAKQSARKPSPQKSVSKRSFAQLEARTPTPRDTFHSQRSHSLIRHRSLSDFTDPFMSKRATPLTKCSKQDTRNAKNVRSKSPLKNDKRPLLSISSAQRKAINVSSSNALSPLKSLPTLNQNSPVRNNNKSKIPLSTNVRLNFTSKLTTKSKFKSPQESSKTIGLGIYQHKSPSVLDKEADLILSDLDIEYEDNGPETVDKENIKPPTPSEFKHDVANFSNAGYFNLSAIDAETF